MPKEQILRHELIRRLEEMKLLEICVKAGIMPFSVKSNYLAYKQYLDCIESGGSPADAIIEMTIGTNYGQRRAYQIVRSMEETVTYIV